MRELPHHGAGPNPGEYFDAYAAPAGAAGAAGAAGIGVARARSMRDGGYAAGLTEGSSPYAAFAGRANNGANAQPQYPPGMIRGAGGPEFDLNRRPSQYTQQTDYSALSRNKSHNTTNSTSAPSYQTDPSSFYPPSSDNGGVAYAQGQGGYPNSYGAYASPSNGGAAAGQQKLQPIPSSRSEEDLNAAYDGYVDEPQQMQTKDPTSSPPGALPNPFSATGRPGEYDDETDDEVEEPRRVLKVFQITSRLRDKDLKNFCRLRMSKMRESNRHFNEKRKKPPKKIKPCIFSILCPVVLYPYPMSISNCAMFMSSHTLPRRLPTHRHSFPLPILPFSIS